MYGRGGYSPLATPPVIGDDKTPPTNKMQITEILSKLETRDALASSTSLGTIKTAFPDHKMLVVRKSKNGAARAAILLEKDGKVTTVVVSEEMTPLVRQGKVKEEHLAQFPLVYNEKRNTLFLGKPATGWVEVKEIEVVDFDLSDIIFQGE